MPRDLRDSAVVITGASSGIGRCAALRFAREGARLMLAARRVGPLEEVARACRAAGATVEVRSVDVRDEDAVRALAAAAIDAYGRIDVWVNNAGVIAYGPFEQVPSDIFRAVMETNLMGQVHGSRAAIARFRAQGQGTLINVASVWARVTTPDVSAYVTSKFAIRAFSECLRQELADTPAIQVAVILPQAVDTPIFANAANFDGRQPRPIPPLLHPETVADGIVRCARDPRREVTCGLSGRALEKLHSLAPRLYERIVPAAFAAGNYAPSRTSVTAGNVLEPCGQHAIHGGWRQTRRRELIRAFRDAALGGLRGIVRRPPASRPPAAGA